MINKVRILPVWPLLAILAAFLCLALLSYAEMAPKPEQISGLAKRVEANKPIFTSIDNNSPISHVVLKLKDDSDIHLHSGNLMATGNSPATALNLILAPYSDKKMRRLFSDHSKQQLERQRDILQARSQQALADLNSYYRIDVTNPAEATDLINRLNTLEIVEIAYFEPVPEEAGDIDPVTPDYEASQDYLRPAPDGIDADYANTLPGGDGTDVKIVDIEINWQTTHEDLDKALGGVIGSYPGGGTSGHHGTAVIGTMIAGDNGYGVTGICPEADIGMVSISTISTAEAIYTAVDNLQQGDFILIELHAPGPRYNFNSRPDQLGYICMEYWQANFDAMQYAWAKGIVVMEPAGNGAEDYDDFAMYGSVFDTTWRNSHAIIIGAGYPPSSGTDRYRQSYSNYGERVNLQGYGSGVYTCGYGHLFDGDGDINQYYTASFGGTSSASPIVTGAAACLQGYYKANFGANLTSDIIRDVLITTGTMQSGDTTEHIGPRPDLAAAIPALTPPPSLYADPFVLDTSIAEDELITIPVWLHNRSASMAIDFEIFAQDTIDTRDTGLWLESTPSEGTIAFADSVEITITLDATNLADSFLRYKGLFTINWGPGGGLLDSTTIIPVYVTVPCNDMTYSIASSEDPEGPVFDWISARALGTRISNSAFYNNGTIDPLDDGTAGPRNVGFVFPYFDTTYNRFYAGVNGAISFTDTALNAAGYFTGVEIPGAPFATMIAPFWGDLIFDEIANPDAGVYYYNPPSYDSLIVEWYHPGTFISPDDTTINFEIILSIDGSILFQYADVGVSSIGQDVTVGIGADDCRASNYEQISSSGVVTGQAIIFSYADRALIRAGNVNGLEGLDISDLVYLVTYMFQSGPEPIPIESGDINCSGGPVDISDLVYLVTYMFSGGPEPCYFWQML